MSEVWVVNASPIIVLAKVGHLSLLKELADELLLPDAVATELSDSLRIDDGAGRDLLSHLESFQMFSDP